VGKVEIQMHAILRCGSRIAATFFLTFGLAHGVAWACSCAPDDAAGYVAQGDAIVLADVERVHGGGCGGAMHVLVDATEVIAGPGELGEQRVHAAPNTSACGLGIHEGETWVLQVIAGDPDRLSECTASQPVDGPDDPWVVALREAADAAE
jgi:hypothetical protein